MKIIKLNKITASLFVLLSIFTYSQKVNLIILQNDEIITTPTALEFNNKASTDGYTFSYSPGKEIDTKVSPVFKEDMILKFTSYGNKKYSNKWYDYNIPIGKGMLENTSFLIIKIYTLDTRKLQKKYCRAKDYVVDFHKSALYIQTAHACK